MADTKLTALTETTSPATTDDVYIVTTPGGTPASKRSTIANLAATIGTLTSQRIGQAVAGVGGASYLEVGSIPATYSSIRCACFGKCDSSSTAQAINLTINGDGGGNYDIEVIISYATTLAASEALAGTSIQVGNFSDSTGPANAADQVVFEILGYANTTFQKTLWFQGTSKLSTASSGVRTRLGAGWWRSTSAITTLRLTPGSGKFLQGSTMTVWGLY